MATNLHRLLAHGHRPVGFSKDQLRDACERLDAIEENSEAAEEWADRLRGSHMRYYGDESRHNTFLDWLSVLARALVKGIQWLIEHPAVIKFLLSLLLAFVGEPGDESCEFPSIEYLDG